MKPIKRKYLKYLLLGVICFLVLWLWPQKKEKENGHPRDYAEIIASGILHAATEYNSSALRGRRYGDWLSLRTDRSLRPGQESRHRYLQ